MNILNSNQDPPEVLGGLLRVCLSCNPAFSPLLRAYDEWMAHLQKKYIQESLEEIERRLKNVERKEIFSDADVQIIILILEKIRIEHNADKRIRFAHILESTLAKESTLSYDLQRRFTDATDCFSDIHIMILKLLNETSEPIATKTLKDKLNLPIRTEILPALNLLCGDFGFVKRQWNDGGLLLLTTNLSPEGIAIKCECEITELGKKYLKAVIANFPDKIKEETKR